MSSTIILTGGRHRFGTPGLIHVIGMIPVIRRGFFAALFRPGKHRLRQRLDTPVPAPSPVTA